MKKRRKRFALILNLIFTLQVLNISQISFAYSQIVYAEEKNKEFKSLDENSKIIDCDNNSTTSSAIQSNTRSVEIPTDLQVNIMDNGDVQLEWSNCNENIAGYEIYKNDEKIGNTEYTSYLDGKFEQGKYTYKVRAYDEEGNTSEFSSEVILEDDYPNYKYEGAPIDIGKEIEGKINYKNDQDCFSFTVEISGVYVIESTGETSVLAMLYVNDGAYIDIDYHLKDDKNFKLEAELEQGKIYNLEITPSSYETKGFYKFIVKDAEPPTQPFGLHVNETENERVHIQWDSSNDNFGVAGYEIYRNGEKIGTTHKTSFEDVRLIEGKHSYKVRAYDHQGNLSKFSEEIVLEDDYGNDIETSTPIDIGTEVKGNIEDIFDEDFFSFTVDETGIYTIDSVESKGLRQVFYSNEQVELKSFVLSYSNKEIMLSKGETYYVKLKSWGDKGSYQFIINKLEPDFEDTEPPTIPGGVKIYTKLPDLRFPIELTPRGNDVCLSWEESKDNLDVEGYIVYRDGKQIGMEEHSKWARNWVCISNLVTGGTHVFKMRAYDKAGNLSGFSNEIIIEDDYGNNSELLTPINLEEYVEGKINYDGDEDFFSFKVNESGRYIIEIIGTNDGWLYSSDRKRMGERTYTPDICTIVEELEKEKTYYLELSGKIGSYKFIVKKAFEDNEAPTVPKNLSFEMGEEKLYLYWKESFDNIKVKGYEVYRDGQKIGTTDETRFEDVGFTLGKHSYKVRAYDGKDNFSEFSSELLVEDDYLNCMNQGSSIDIGKEIEGKINYKDDQDYFRLNIENSGLYVIEVKGEVDFYSGFYDKDGKELKRKYINKGENFRIIKELQAGRAYYLKVGYDLTDINIGNYKIEVKDVSKDIVEPLRPQNLTLKGNSQGIEISWSASKDDVLLKGYEIYKDGQKIGTTEETKYIDNEFRADSHVYRVRAYDAAGNLSEFSSELIFNDDFGNGIEHASSIPLGTEIKGEVNYKEDIDYISFTANITGVHYIESKSSLYLKGYLYDNNKKLLESNDNAGLGRDFRIVKELQAGVTYYLAVQNIFDENEVYSINIIQPPAAPIGLSVASSSEKTITLSWKSPNIDGKVKRYKIYRDGTYLTSTNTTQYTDTGLQANSTYKYAVSACGTNGIESQQSKVVTGSTIVDTEAPQVPANLKVVSKTGSTVSLKWTAPSDNVGVVQYKIYRDGKEIGTSSETSFTDKGLTEKVTYKYEVKAYDASNNSSEFSNSVQVIPLMPRITSIIPSNGFTIGGDEPQRLTLYFANSDNITGSRATLEYSLDEQNWNSIKGQMYGVNYNSEEAYFYWDCNLEDLSTGNYKFRYSVYDAANNVSQQIVTYMIDKTAPDVLKGVTAQAGEGCIYLSWEVASDSDVKCYRIYRAIEGNEQFQLIKQIDGRDKVSYTDINVTDGESYVYIIKAVDIFNQESLNSNTVKIKVIKDSVSPIILGIQPIEGEKIGGKTHIIVRAEDNIGLSEIKLQYSVEENKWIDIETISTEGTAEFKWDTSALNGEVKVRAVAFDKAGNASDGNTTRTYTIDNLGPEKVTGLSYTPYASRVILKWNDVKDEDFAYFQVERKDISHGEFKNIGTVDDTLGMNITGLKHNTVYLFRVIAYDRFGNRGTSSDEIQVSTTADTIPPVVTSIEPRPGRYCSIIPVKIKVTDDVLVDTVKIQISRDKKSWREIATITPNEDNRSNINISYDLDVSSQEEGNIFVRAVAADTSGNISDTSEKAPYAEHIIDHTAPKKTEGFKVTPEQGYIALEWNQGAEKDLSAYNLYRASSEDGSYQLIADSISMLKYYDRNVEVDTIYYYKIEAVDIAGNASEKTGYISAKMLEDKEIPRILSVSRSDGDTMGANPEIKVLAADNYKLSEVKAEYKVNENSEEKWILIDKQELNSYSEVVTLNWNTVNLNEENYHVRITAVDKSENESIPLELNYNLNLQSPSKPNLSVVPGGWKASLNWTCDVEDDFKTFKIYRSKEQGKNYKLIGQTTEKDYTDEVLTPGRAYYYKVEAVDNYDNISCSDEVFAIPEEEDTYAPTIPELEEVIGVRGCQVQFDGRKATDNDRIVRYEWDFGDGNVGSSAQPRYTYNKEGEYTVTLTVYDAYGNSAETHTKVFIHDPKEVGNVKLKVIDSSTGTALSQASVVIELPDGNTRKLSTDSLGRVNLIEGQGEYKIYAYKNGYKPVARQCTVEKDRENNVTIALARGAVVKGNINVQRMRLDEIINSGIDIYAPENQWVYKCDVHLAFRKQEVPPIIINGEGEILSGGGWFEYKADIQFGGGKYKICPKAIAHPGHPEVPPTIAYIVIPAEASWTKEFFEVSLCVLNNADSEFPIDNGEATLILPDGLSLAPTVESQKPKIRLGTINGGAQKQVYWIIRGDKKGYYDLEAEFNGTLQPFNEPVRTVFRTKEPFRVWGDDALEMYVEAEDWAFNGEPYYVLLGLKNVSDAPVYNPRIKIGKGENFKVSETALEDIPIPVIMPGDIYLVGTMIIPSFPDGDQGDSYKLDLSKSFVVNTSGEDVNVPTYIKSIPSSRKRYHQKVIDLSLIADPVDSATGAHIIKRSPINVSGKSSLGFNITYNSSMLDISDIGRGWKHDFQTTLELLKDENLIINWSPSFGEKFYKRGENEYIPLDNKESRAKKIVRNEDGSFRMILKDFTEYEFNSKGNLSKIKNRTGNILLLDYDSKGRLSRLTEECSNQSLTISYNEQNLINKVTDKLNRNVLFNYDEHKNLIKITTPDGKSMNYTYDGNGHVLTGVDEEGTVFKNTYDSLGRVLSQDDGIGENELTTFTYESQPRKFVTTIKDRSGNTKVYTFNRKYDVIKIENGLGNAREYSYDIHGNRIREKDPEGNVISYEYDARGNMLAVTDSLGNKTKMTYDERDNLITVDNPSGSKVVNTYDENNHLISTVNTLGNINTYKYDKYGNLVSKTLSGVGTNNFTYENGKIKTVTDLLENITENEYDAAGRLISVTDREGNTTKFAYDSMDNLISVTDAEENTTKYTYNYRRNKLTETDSKGNITRYSYNGNGNLIKVTAPSGIEIRYEYDGEGRLIKTIDGDNNESIITYDAAGRVISETDAENNTIAYEYDKNGRVRTITLPKLGITTYTYTKNAKIKTITDANNNTVTYDYDSEGRRTAVIDAEGNTKKFSYDASGNLLKVEDPLGNVVRYTYDIQGNLLTARDARGNITTYNYNSNGKLISAIDALGNKTEYKYNKEGRLVKTTDARGNEVTVDYSSLGRVTSITDQMGRTISTEYDELGNIIWKKDNTGRKVFTAEYDNLGRPIKQKDALDNSVINHYDRLGRLVEIVDKMGRSTKFSYDKLGRLVSVEDPLKGIATKSFDKDGNVSSITDPNNNETTFEYDLVGNLISETTSIGSSKTYGYNSRNLLQEITNARGQKAVHEYDAAGRIIKVKYAEGTVEYTYDENGNILTVSDDKGTITREYDALNRVTKYTDARGNAIGYEYDSVGNLVSITYPNGKKVTYDYDKSNALIKVTDWAGRITEYEYNENGQHSKIIRPDGTVQIMDYDAAGQIIKIKDVDRNGTIINQYDFEYDQSGNVTKEDKSNPSKPYKTDNITMTYDRSNRLGTYNGQEVSYDADGNMIIGPLQGKMVNFAYDSRNRLTSGGDTLYSYDAENNRIGVNVNGEEIQYVVNPQTRLSQVLVSRDSKGNETYYIYGLGLIAQEDSEGNYRTYHYDRRGSTTAITDEEGKITDRIDYGPYGELIEKTGSTETPFLYNGRYGVMTDNNGLYYMRARYYNPDIKRFINQDVVLGSINDGRTMNRYAYVNGNPISYVDPFGLSADSDGFLGFVHSALDVLGFIPGIGEICDGVNGVIYLLEGDYKNAFLSSICMIPMLGDVLGKGAKWGKEALENGAKFFIRHSDEALEIAEFGIKHFDEVGDSAKYFDEAAEIASNKGKSNFLHIDVQFFASKETGEAGETLTRRGAFRKSKRDAGIPNSSQHKKAKYVYDGTSENRWVYEFDEYTEDGYQKFIVEHREDKFGRGPHFHGADSGGDVSPLQKGRYNQYNGHYPENFEGYKRP